MWQSTGVKPRYHSVPPQKSELIIQNTPSENPSSYLHCSCDCWELKNEDMLFSKHGEGEEGIQRTGIPW